MLIGPNLTPETVNLRYDSNFFKVKVYYCQRLLVATGWMCHVQKPKVTSLGLRLVRYCYKDQETVEMLLGLNLWFAIILPLFAEL